MPFYQRKTGSAAPGQKLIGGAAKGPTKAGTRIQASTFVVYPGKTPVYTELAGLSEPVIRCSVLAAFHTSGGNLGFLAEKAPILADKDVRV